MSNVFFVLYAKNDCVPIYSYKISAVLCYAADMLQFNVIKLLF